MVSKHTMGPLSPRGPSFPGGPWQKIQVNTIQILYRFIMFKVYCVLLFKYNGGYACKTNV